MPTQNVDAMAIENASWMPVDDVGISGCDDGLLIGRHDGEDPRPEIAGAGQVEPRRRATAAELVDHLRRHAGLRELDRDLGRSAGRRRSSRRS